MKENGLCYICEENNFSGHNCKGSLLSLIQQVANDAGIQNQQDVQNQDHTIQHPLHVFPGSIYSYTNQDIPQPSFIAVEQGITNISRIKGMLRRSQSRQLHATCSFPNFCHLQLNLQAIDDIFQVHKGFFS